MLVKPCDSRGNVLMPRLVSEAPVPRQTSGRLDASTSCPNLLQQRGKNERSFTNEYFQHVMTCPVWAAFLGEVGNLGMSVQIQTVNI